MKVVTEATVDMEEEAAVTTAVAGELPGMTDPTVVETKEATAEEVVADTIEMVVVATEVAVATETESKMTLRTPNYSWVD